MTTYYLTERGNGFPTVGDEVILADESGWHILLVITRRSRIETQQWQANRLRVECEASERKWDDLRDDEQDELWESLHHVERTR